MKVVKRTFLASSVPLHAFENTIFGVFAMIGAKELGNGERVQRHMKSRLMIM